MLDPVRALVTYLKRTESRRGELDSLLITFGGKSFKTPPQTVARWLCEVITRATGTRRHEVKGQSTRAMSTSVAFGRGLSVDAILQAADWSSSSTFGRFYLQGVLQERCAFGRSILGDATAN